MMTQEEYIQNVVHYNCGYILAQYQKMILQWWGDDFLTRAPDSVLNFFQNVMQSAAQAKKALKQAKEEQDNENQDTGASGCDGEGGSLENDTEPSRIIKLGSK